MSLKTRDKMSRVSEYLEEWTAPVGDFCASERELSKASECLK